MQLSRALAWRGHEVTHAYAASRQAPQGALSLRDDDPAGLRIEGISISGRFQKHNFLKRRFQELEYGRLIAGRVGEIQPDWVISGNTPSEPQAMLLRRCRKLGIGFASWVQDFYGLAVYNLLRSRIPILGALVGRYYMRIDRWVLRRSDEIILITDDFRPLVHEMGVQPDRVHVIENWAPLDELPLRPRINPWSEKHELSNKFVFLYSGTLGMKHNPALLLELARGLQDEDQVRVVICSEGLGADWLREKKGELGVDNLLLLPFQLSEEMPDVLASSEVLVAILEPDAGVFSVPSKVLTYLCAGKPVLAAMPAENLAARIIEKAGAGIVEAPDAAPAFVRAGARLRGDPGLRRRAGIDARRYAERSFDVEQVADAFMDVVLRRPRLGADTSPVRES